MKMPTETPVGRTGAGHYMACQIKGGKMWFWMPQISELRSYGINNVISMGWLYGGNMLVLC